MTRADSLSHCANIRQLPCLKCGAQSAGTVHHLKQGTGERGGTRSSDQWGVPLCWGCHVFDHGCIESFGSTREHETFVAWGIADVLQVARDLWAARASFERMFTIVQHHRAGLPI